MHDWMTSRHEGCVSTMLTDKRLKYCTAGAPVQGPGRLKKGVQAEKHPKCRACRLASSISSRQTLEVAQSSCNTQVAFGEHRAHTAFMSTGHPAMHEVQYLGIGVAVVTRP